MTEMARRGASYGPKVEKSRSHPATTLRGHLPCGCNEEEEISLVWSAGEYSGDWNFPQLPTSIGTWKLKDEKSCMSILLETENENRATSCDQQRRATGVRCISGQWACLNYASSHLTRLPAKLCPSFGATCLHNPSFVRHRPFCLRAWVSFLEGTTSIQAETSPCAVLDKTCRWGT